MKNQDAATAANVLDWQPGAPWRGPNRRRTPRVALNFRAHDQGDPSPLVGLDLGMDGMRCISRQPLWPGNGIALSLEVAGHPALCVKGQVVGLAMQGDEVAMCIAFTHVGEAQRQVIAAITGLAKSAISDHPPTNSSQRSAGSPALLVE